MDNYIIGIILFFAAFLVSITLLARAGTKLDREKLLLLSGMNSIRTRSYFGVILLILLVSLLGAKFQQIHPSVSFYAIIFIFIAYAVLSFVLTFKKLTKNSFPKSYINTYLFCLIIRVVGGVLLFSFAYPF